MNHDEMKDLIPALALGALEEGEEKAARAHLESCAECRAELQAMERVMAGLGEGSAAQQPPAALRGRVLAAAGAIAPVAGATAPVAEASAAPASAPPTLQVVKGGRGVASWAGWGLAVAASAALIYSVPSLQKIQFLLGRQTQTADSLRHEMALREAELQRNREQMELLTSPDSRSVSLASQPATREAAARVVYSAKLKRARLFVQNLPPAGEGKIYEVWLLAGGKPIPAGLFKPDSSGSFQLDLTGNLADLKTAAAFAVTLEPAGGVPAPTGPMVLVGKVQ